MYQIKPQPIPTAEIRAARKEVLDWERNNRTFLNRAIKDGQCQWYATETSPGCAVGRLCSPEQQKALANMKMGDNPIDFLPDSVKKLGKSFLGWLQTLHDSHENWNEQGLSKIGMENWEAIHHAFVFAV